MTPRTFESFVQTGDLEKKRLNLKAAAEWVRKRILECMDDPKKHADDPLTLIAAQWEWERQPMHHCYWNNRFALAVMCGLSFEEIQMAAWCLVSNGLNGYFEWSTHSGYDMTVVFNHLGIDTAKVVKPDSRMYAHLPRPICIELIKMFNLPTTTLGVKSRLTNEEQERKSWLEQHYSYTPIL